jgi:hypothetical protein
MPQVKGNSLYLHHFYTREKRAKQPHLLDGFLPIGFPRSYLVFICGWFDCILLFSIFCILSISCISIKSLTKYSGDVKKK